MRFPAAVAIALGLSVLPALGPASAGAVSPPATSNISTHGCYSGPHAGTGLCAPGGATIVSASGTYGVTATGSVFTSQTGPAPGVSSLHLASSIVAVLSFTAPNYWLAGADGGVFAFGLPYLGSMGGHPLNEPVVAMAGFYGPTVSRGTSGPGYWLVSSDGGVFAFGEAQFYGSMGGHPLNSPIVGITSTADERGYWLVGADGGVFAFGDAPFYGSAAGQHLDASAVGLVGDTRDGGYWLVAGDGGVFTFGGAVFWASFKGLVRTRVVSSLEDTGGPPYTPNDPTGYCVVLTTGQSYCAPP